MNKTNLITLTILLFFSLAFVSCKKKGCTDPVATNYSSDADKDDGSCVYTQTPTPGSGNIIDGTPMVSYTIDGNEVSHQASMSIFSATGSSTSIGQGTTDAVWSSYLYDDVQEYNLFDASKGIQSFSGVLSNDDFYDYFTPGTYSYADLSEEGVSIEIGSPNGINYRSADGPQVGSTFEIVSRKKVNTGIEMEVKVHIKFSCKVYRGNDVKTITNGVYVGSFSQ